MLFSEEKRDWHNGSLLLSQERILTEDGAILAGEAFEVVEITDTQAGVKYGVRNCISDKVYYLTDADKFCFRTGFELENRDWKSFSWGDAPDENTKDLVSSLRYEYMCMELYSLARDVKGVFPYQLLSALFCSIFGLTCLIQKIESGVVWLAWLLCGIATLFLSSYSVKCVRRVKTLTRTELKHISDELLFGDRMRSNDFLWSFLKIFVLSVSCVASFEIGRSLF